MRLVDLLIFFFPETFFQEYHQSVKQSLVYYHITIHFLSGWIGQMWVGATKAEPGDSHNQIFVQLGMLR